MAISRINSSSPNVEVAAAIARALSEQILTLSSRFDRGTIDFIQELGEVEATEDGVANWPSDIVTDKTSADRPFLALDKRIVDWTTEDRKTAHIFSREHGKVFGDEQRRASWYSQFTLEALTRALTHGFEGQQSDMAGQG